MIDFWRDLDTGPNSLSEVYAVVETPKGNENRYEYDVTKRAIVLDRVLYSAMQYPGDTLDVLVLVTNPTFPGCIVTVPPIGLLRMLDGDVRDDKVLSVPIDDIRYDKVRNLTDVPEHIMKEIAHLFETNKVLEGKTTKILDWSNAEEAKATIQRSQELYTRKIT
jgi:inorganic pyrophosphatase